MYSRQEEGFARRNNETAKRSAAGKEGEGWDLARAHKAAGGTYMESNIVYESFWWDGSLERYLLFGGIGKAR